LDQGIPDDPHGGAVVQWVAVCFQGLVQLGFGTLHLVCQLLSPRIMGCTAGLPLRQLLSNGACIGHQGQGSLAAVAI
jgi:hypothetical protein